MARSFAFLFVILSVVSGWAQTDSETAKLPDIQNQTTASGESVTSEAEGDGKGDGKAIERVEVTGSHIKRIDVEGALPVQTINRQDLDKSGYNSVSDVLRDTAANSFGSLREEAGSNAAGVAHVSLRGLGSTNTLVLLNGQRLPTDAITGAVDLNLIPMAAVERVEILKDGASATYGSDALGGVVNIITRKDFSGSEISLMQTQPQLAGGVKKEISLVNGLNREKLNMVNVVQYRDNATIMSKDRDWSNDGTSTTGSPGSYRSAGAGQTWKADPNCPPEMVVSTPGGDFCSFRHTDYSTEYPSLQQIGLLSETNYELSSRVKMKFRLGGTQKRAQWSYAPAPGSFTIPAAVADKLGPNGGPMPGATPGKDLTVRYRLTELGTRDTEVKTDAVNVLAGTTVDAGKGFEVDMNIGHNVVYNEDKGVRGYALTADLVKAIEDGKFNPFAPEGSRGNIEHTRYQPVERTMSLLSSAEAKVSGPLYELGSGPISGAFGTTFTFQKFEDVFDDKSVAGEVFGNAGSSGGGQRDTKAVFSELSIPVAQKVELQLAGRFDHYSDFGSTTNPKAALLYRPNKNWLLRTSAGTGFKAPRMQDLYAATGLGYPTFIDAVACEREKAADPNNTPSCKPTQYQVTSGGNEGLKEEKSETMNFGAVFEPTKEFSIGADYFVTRIKNVVGIDYNDLMEAERDGINVAEKGVIVTRDSNGYIESITAPMQNLAAQEVSGIDLSTAYRVRKVKLGVEHSQLLYFKEEGFPGTGLKDKLGENGRPAWRNTLSVGYLPNDNHDITASAMTIASHEKAVKEMGNLGQYTQIDLQYQYRNRSLGTFTAGVKNLFATTPPLDDSVPNDQLDDTLYDQVGRAVYAGYKKTF
ncbi:MAG TPA: TonB-dependent receptor [Bdellovibrionales bacterium]|nr:TonB-dependent receptor [Bdellovibrionales bacterium]